MTYRDTFVDFLGDADLVDRYCRDARVGDAGPLDRAGAERLAMWIYACGDTRWPERLNAALWDGDSSAAVKGFEDVLNAALAELAPYRGVVYRGFTEPDLEDLLSEYGVGGDVRWFEFASCATSPEIAFEGNVLFIIASRTGRLLAPCAGGPGEPEVVFASGSRFQVRAVERRGDRAAIELKELEP